MWGVPFVAKKVKKDKLYEKVKARKTIKETPTEEVNLHVYPFEVGALITHKDYGDGIVDTYVGLDTISCIFSKTKRIVSVDTITLVGDTGA